jgi:hypothetical protein
MNKFFFGYASGKEAARGVVSKTGELTTAIKSSVAHALYGNPATASDFGTLTAAIGNASNLNSICMLGADLTNRERDAVLENAFGSTAQTYSDFLQIIRLSRVKPDAEKWRTGKGETAAVVEGSLEKPNKVKLEQAKATLAKTHEARKANRQQPQASANKEVDVPVAVAMAPRAQWATAVAALESQFAGASFRVTPKESEQLQRIAAECFKVLHNIGDKMK